VSVSDVGLRDSEKSGTGAGLTVSVTFVEWRSEPLVPVTVSVKVPVAVPVVVLTVRVEFAVGVTGLGSEQVARDGQPVTVSATLPLNPFNAVAVMVEVPDPPWVSVSDVGLADIEKSGTGGVPQQTSWKYSVGKYGSQLITVSLLTCEEITQAQLRPPNDLAGM
jgi:hypothetical protein